MLEHGEHILLTESGCDVKLKMSEHALRLAVAEPRYDRQHALFAEGSGRRGSTAASGSVHLLPALFERVARLAACLVDGTYARQHFKIRHLVMEQPIDILGLSFAPCGKRAVKNRYGIRRVDFEQAVINTCACAYCPR